MKVRLDLCFTCSSVEIDLSGTALQLWNKAQQSDADEDWTEFAMYVAEDVAEKIDFDIEDGEELSA